MTLFFFYFIYGIIIKTLKGAILIRKNGHSKKTSKLKRWLTNIFLLLLLVIGLALVFNEQIKSLFVQNMTTSNQVDKLTVKKITRNKQKKATFDFNSVESLDFDTIVRAQLYKDKLAVIGGIAAPSVKLNLPIIKGVSNYALAVGAGTMKEDQKMGEGNYALASHHMINESLLFSPLVNIKQDAVVYLTDLSTIYTYKVTSTEYVTPDRVDVIEDVPGKKLLTLVTCDTTGNKRLIVHCELSSSTTTKKASADAKKAFNIQKNTY